VRSPTGKPRSFLSDLSPQGLLEVLELELVEDAQDLDPEGRLLITAVQSVGKKDDPDPLEVRISTPSRGLAFQGSVKVKAESRQVVEIEHRHPNTSRDLSK
jgi:hypothetical protein